MIVAQIPNLGEVNMPILNWGLDGNASAQEACLEVFIVGGICALSG